MFNAAQSRIDRMAMEDGITPEQAFTNQTTAAGNPSMGPLRPHKRSNIPVSAPAESPTQATHKPCKLVSSYNDTEYPSATIDMDVPGYERTSHSCYLRYGRTLSSYDPCRYILNAALSVITAWENTLEEEEEEEEEEEMEEEDEDEEDEEMEEEDEDEEEEMEEDEEEEDKEGEDEEEEYYTMEEEEYEEYEEYEEECEDDDDHYTENNCIICALFKFIRMLFSPGRGTA
ncbi:uncharacterized protein LOC628053 [Mus musculus]|uniref:uncharacterized protein LOC628053 n=1 Tax=Mus musculus TaxID=10090 RepID=UPI0000D680AA|nr:uncharacterized protein LOC628053 [Mus musculus]|eukprot:NP_001074945.1 predicted gene 14725 [Mus musculus]